ncbi:MAG: hypothetical protein E7365_06160 [Clostridiales bacterium]|nr:hypothetical protein [Clostridiales bacterium]
MSEQLCWNCKKATGKCSWSALGKAVKGWDATPTKIKNSTTPFTEIDSYEIRACPLFEGDNIQEKEKRTRVVKVEELQKLFGCSYGTVCRMDTEQVIERAKEKGINLMAIDGKKRKFHKI